MIVVKLCFDEIFVVSYVISYKMLVTFDSNKDIQTIFLNNMINIHSLRKLLKYFFGKFQKIKLFKNYLDFIKILEYDGEFFITL